MKLYFQKKILRKFYVPRLAYPHHSWGTLLERTIVLENDVYPSWASVPCYICQGKTPEGIIQGCIEYRWSTTPYRMYTAKQTLTLPLNLKLGNI
jgi:hypothetical protein